MDKQKIVFVTVGSTQFAELVAAMMTETILNVLKANNYTDIVIQYGAYLS